MKNALRLLTVGFSLAVLGGGMSDLLAAEVELGGLKSNTPSNWKMEKPKSKFRAFQFVIPRAEGDKADATLVIYYFGPGGGGGVDANIARWKKMLEPPKGKKIEDVSKLQKFKVSDAEVVQLDVKGTYLERFPPFAPNAKITRRPNYHMIGVIFGKGPYYFRLVGPAKTVAANEKGFEKWLKGFK